MLHATFLVIVIKVDKNHRGYGKELGFAASKRVCNVLLLLRSKKPFHDQLHFWNVKVGFTF